MPLENVPERAVVCVVSRGVDGPYYAEVWDGDTMEPVHSVGALSRGSVMAEAARLRSEVAAAKNPDKGNASP